jgi:hypothetical protein
MLYCCKSPTTLPKVMSAILPSRPSVLPRKGLLDRLGATGSMLCAVHCAALPVVLAIAPALGAGLANETFEIGFIAFASLLGLTSLVIGYRRHRVGRALAFLVPGIALLWTAALLESLHQNLILHAIAMATGGTLIATAHVLNLRLTHAQKHAEHCLH